MIGFVSAISARSYDVPGSHRRRLSAPRGRLHDLLWPRTNGRARSDCEVHQIVTFGACNCRSLRPHRNKRLNTLRGGSHVIHFDHAAFGGSFLNHQWLIAARTSEFPIAQAIAGAVDNPDAAVYGANENAVSVDGFVINTAFSVNSPHAFFPVAPNKLVPNRTGDTDVISGDKRRLAIIDAVRNGPNWKDTATIVTYDENGGFWDHVAPPKVDKWGPARACRRS